MTKTCTNCKIEKDLSDFRIRSKDKQTYQSWCKNCHSVHAKIYYSENRNNRKEKVASRRIDTLSNNRNYIWNIIFNAKCSNCGLKDSTVLDFDHKDPSNKEYTIATMHTMSLDKIKKEIEKCNILCRNCHVIKTQEQFNFWRFQFFKNALNDSNNQIFDETLKCTEVGMDEII